MTTSLTLVRRIAARPSIVFECLTTADGVAAWWGPDDLPVLLAEVDPRIGGVFRIRFRTLDGGEHEACGEFLELVPTQRIAMSWRWIFGGEPEEFGRTSHIECDIRPIEGGSELTFTHENLRNAASVESHTMGWTGSMAKLVARLGEFASTLQPNPENP